MTPRQLEILQHSLGCDKYGRGKDVGHGEFNRNYFCAGAEDEPTCRELVALGYMKEHLRTELYPYFNCSVTDDGKAAMREASPKPPKLTRSQRRYREYLGWKDAYGGTFRGFLTDMKARKEIQQ